MKPDTARAIEDSIIRAAQYGQLQGQITEEHLIRMLETYSEQTRKPTEIVYNRRNTEFDSDDEI